MKVKKLKVPKDLSGLQLNTFAKLQEITERNDEAILFDVISVMFGLPESVVRDQPQSFIEAAGLEIANLLYKPIAPLYEFEINGKEFGLIPDFTEGALSYGEFIDLSTYIKRLDNGVRDPESMARFMAVAYRPIVKRSAGLYEIEDYNGTDKYYKTMLTANAAQFLGAESFFLSLRQILKAGFLIYSDNLKGTPAKQGKNYSKFLDITGHSVSWQMTTILKLRHLLKSRL